MVEREMRLIYNDLGIFVDKILKGIWCWKSSIFLSDLLEMYVIFGNKMSWKWFFDFWCWDGELDLRVFKIVIFLYCYK